MTKINLKKLREHCDWDLLQTFVDDRFVFAEECLPLLDWIERVRGYLPGILCDLDKGAPTDRNIALAQLLAELEE